MVYRTRIKYTPERKADIWSRWEKGESLKSIGRLFDRPSSSIFTMLAPTGGIRPPIRKRSRLTLTLSDREDISRGIATGLTIRSIAENIHRSPSAVKSNVMAVMMSIEPRKRIRQHGIEVSDQSAVNLSVITH
jgi:DNA-binding CsgD family transcriptional regulator